MDAQTDASAPARPNTQGLLYDGPEWDFELVKRTYDAIVAK